MPLYAGVCETNITPPPDGWLGGRGDKRRCTGIHEDLYARVLVLDNGQKRVALIAADVMAAPEEWTRDTRQRVADDLHTQSGAIMLHYAGGQGGPAMPALNGAGEYDHAYMEILKRKIAGAARQAVNALLPASLTYGEASAQIGVHQRLTVTDDKATRFNDYGGPVSSLVQTLCVNGADGQTFAVLFSHACAPDTQGNNNACITADWPGASVAHLKQRFWKEAADTGIASDALPFCLPGCGANVAPLRQGSWEAVQTNGRIIADAAHTARWNAHGRLAETLDWTESTVALPLSPPPSYQECEEILAHINRDLERALTEGDEARHLLLTEQWYWASEMRQAASHLHPVLHQPFTIQKLNLGGVSVLGFPAKMCVEYQQAFLALSNAPVFCLGTANGDIGILPSEPDREQGGYEASQAYRQQRALTFAPGFEAVIHTAVRELLPADEYA